MKCEVCGKPNQNREDNYCYGCYHIVCVECCIDEHGDLIGGEHDLMDHKDAYRKKLKQGGVEIRV